MTYDRSAKVGLPSTGPFLSYMTTFMLSGSLVCIASNPAFTADFTVSNETEFLQAIDNANISLDPSSTIILANSFTITGSGLSTVTQNLSIDMAGHTLTSSFDTEFEIAQGAMLTLDGSLNITGVSGFSGNMIKSGEGTLRIKGGPSDVFWRVKTTEGLLVFDEGSLFTFGEYFGDVANAESISDVTSGIRVTGPGTVITNRYTTVLQSNTGASLDVEDGAVFNSQGLRLARRIAPSER